MPTTALTWAGRDGGLPSLSDTSAPVGPCSTAYTLARDFLGAGRRELQELAENHYAATHTLAQRPGLGDQVREGLRQTYERVGRAAVVTPNAISAIGRGQFFFAKADPWVGCAVHHQLKDV